MVFAPSPWQSQRAEGRAKLWRKSYGTKIIARNVINFRTIDMRKLVKLFVNWQVYLNALFADDENCRFDSSSVKRKRK